MSRNKGRGSGRGSSDLFISPSASIPIKQRKQSGRTRKHDNEFLTDEIISSFPTLSIEGRIENTQTLSRTCSPISTLSPLAVEPNIRRQNRSKQRSHEDLRKLCLDIESDERGDDFNSSARTRRQSPTVIKRKSHMGEETHQAKSYSDSYELGEKHTAYEDIDGRQLGRKYQSESRLTRAGDASLSSSLPSLRKLVTEPSIDLAPSRTVSSSSPGKFVIPASPPPRPSSDNNRRQNGESWKGRLDYPNNSYYVGGLFKRDDGEVVRQGIGTFFDGVKKKLFEGNFENDLKCGFGTTKYADKFHQGEYKRGLRHGTGVFRFGNGDKYEGEFFKGELHGQGKLTWADGSVFEGLFKRGKIRHGTKRWGEAGEIFEGSFDDQGRPSGFGKTTYYDGSYHRGFYEKGLAEGLGERCDARRGLTTLEEFSKGRTNLSSRLVITSSKENKVLFSGERESLGDFVKDEAFGIYDGPTLHDQANGEETTDEDRIRLQLGHFDIKKIPPRLLSGTYLTSRSKVTAQSFDPGPLVPDDAAGFWHDTQTGNVRWARLGMHHMGPVGKALFVYANGTNLARIELFKEHGEMISSQAYEL